MIGGRGAVTGVSVSFSCAASLISLGIVRQVVEDRTIRPLIAAAVVHQVLQRAPQLLHLRNPAIEIDDVRLCDPPHLGTGAAPVLPQPEQPADSAIEKPRSRARRMNFSVCTSVSS